MTSSDEEAFKSKVPVNNIKSTSFIPEIQKRPIISSQPSSTFCDTNYKNGGANISRSVSEIQNLQSNDFSNVKRVANFDAPTIHLATGDFINLATPTNFSTQSYILDNHQDEPIFKDPSTIIEQQAQNITENTTQQTVSIARSGSEECEDSQKQAPFQRYEAEVLLQEDLDELLFQERFPVNDNTNQIDEGASGVVNNLEMKIDYLTRLVTALTVNQMKMASNISTIMDIMVTPNPVTIADLDDIKLPVDCVENLHKLDEKLLDNAFKAQLVSELYQ